MREFEEWEWGKFRQLGGIIFQPLSPSVFAGSGPRRRSSRRQSRGRYGASSAAQTPTAPTPIAPDGPAARRPHSGHIASIAPARVPGPFHLCRPFRCLLTPLPRISARDDSADQQQMQRWCQRRGRSPCRPLDTRRERGGMCDGGRRALFLLGDEWLGLLYRPMRRGRAIHSFSKLLLKTTTMTHAHLEVSRRLSSHFAYSF